MLTTVSGIKKISKSEWIRVDRGYLDRIAERKDTMRKYPDDVFGTNDIVNPAIEELFREIIITLLPVRFPTMFKIKRGVFHNLATKESYQLEGINHMEMLRILGENVEEDFYIMCPDGHGEWRLQGYIACFPGGFLSPSRVGMSTRQIHQPVPGYEQRIGKGVDRFMQQLEPGTYVERMNVSSITRGTITTPDIVFSTDTSSDDAHSGVSKSMGKIFSARTATITTPSKDEPYPLNLRRLTSI